MSEDLAVKMSARVAVKAETLTIESSLMNPRASSAIFSR